METFAQAVKAVEKSCTALFKSHRYRMNALPEDMPAAGIYVFSKGKRILYVGRTNNLKRRLKYHLGNNHNQATFAFLLAREKTGKTSPSYKKKGSRSDLLRQPAFKSAFNKSLEEIQMMNVQFIAEDDANRQALLEICAAMRSNAKYNKFDNH